MKKLRILIGTVLLSAGLAGCTSAYYASAGYASDDLYAVHDKTQIARRKQAEAEAQRAAAEARRAEWEAKIAEAEAAAAENNYYEYQAADANPYQSVLADDYESAYARRLRGFESPSYKMPSSYLDARYSNAFSYASAYDPAFYNIVVIGRPGVGGTQVHHLDVRIVGHGDLLRSVVLRAGTGPGVRASRSAAGAGASGGTRGTIPGTDPVGDRGTVRGTTPGTDRAGAGVPDGTGIIMVPDAGPGWHGRPYHSNIVRRPNPYTSPSGTRYGVGSRSGSKSTGSMRGGSSGGRNTFGVRDNSGGRNSFGGRYNSGSSSRGGSRYNDNGYRNSGGNTYDRGNSYNSGSSSSYNRGSSPSSGGSYGGGSRGGSGTTSSGGSYRNSGGR